MSLVIVKGSLTQEDLDRAREDYEFYIKITADIEEGIVVIGGEYHADAEKVLLENYGSRQENIWGGGLDLRERRFETSAIINLRPGVNESMEILDPETRARFLGLIQSRLEKLEELL